MVGRKKWFLDAHKNDIKIIKKMILTKYDFSKNS